MKWHSLKKVREIPAEWDDLTGNNIFLTKNFLAHLERVNPCDQTYNLLYLKNSLKAIYVDYLLRLDIFTYSFISMKMPVRIMGIPCSVSRPGFFSLKDYETILWQHFRLKPGAKLILNCETELPGSKGETLPTCKIAIRWDSFTQYLQEMRSHYRYRVKKALEKWRKVKVEMLETVDFDKRLFSLYEEVFRNSSAKLEKLSYEFFQDLPLPSKIIRARYGQEILGFVQMIDNGQELIFLFTGFNHILNSKFDTYLNLLLEIIRYGIDNGFKVIDLGQTSFESKLKLGAKTHSKSIYVAHSNFIIDKLANKYLNLFSYQLPEYNYRVFKNGKSENREF